MPILLATRTTFFPLGVSPRGRERFFTDIWPQSSKCPPPDIRSFSRVSSFVSRRARSTLPLVGLHTLRRTAPRAVVCALHPLSTHTPTPTQLIFFYHMHASALPLHQLSLSEPECHGSECTVATIRSRVPGLSCSYLYRIMFDIARHHTKIS